MRAAVTPEEMRAMEQACFDAGISAMSIMERAAQALTDTLHGLLGGLTGKRIICYCGRGNNGADGLAAARLLKEAGALPVVRLLGQPVTAQGTEQLRLVQGLGIALSEQPIRAADAVVDALYGIGLNRAPEDKANAMIRELNALGVPVLAADIPSGLDALTGRAYMPCVRATLTLTFHALKTGHLLAEDPGVMGELRVADIGIPAGVGVAGISAPQPADLPALLPVRGPRAHKGTHGRTLLYCGKMGSAGAAAMAALGCFRAGGGLVHIACESNIIPVLQVLVPNAQCIPLQEALRQPPRYDVFLGGCGLGQSHTVWEAIKSLYNPNLPAVLDADALNLLAKHPIQLGGLTVLTPHVLEAARLLGMDVQSVMGDMLGAAREIHARYGCTVILKSDRSVIFDGQRWAINTAGSPVLAKGGSGDALGGIIAGLMAQGQSPFDAAQTAALWLGTAAELAHERWGPYAPLTAEILSLMGEAGKGKA